MKQLKYRLAIFDSDGTLADTLPWMRSVFNELADAHGFRKVASNEHERFRDLHGLELLKAIGLPLWKLPAVMNSMRTRMAEHINEFSLFPGINDVLIQLAKGGVRMAVVSSNSRANVERILGPGPAALISHFNCGASVFGKAAKIRATVRACRVPLDDAIYIGDEIRDAEAAKKAGVVFGAVAWGQHTVEALSAQNPAELFMSVAEISEKLCWDERRDAD